MKILVTGATGFVGQHVTRWLVEHNYSVTASGTSSKKAEKFDWYNDVEFKPCDYYNLDIDYLEYFDRPDILIHLGWMNAYQNTVELQLEKNLPKTINFLQNISREGNLKIVGMGTSQEYGNVAGCLKEDQCLNPVTPYGVAKNTLRCYIELLAKEKNIEWNWIRQFYLTGDGQNPKSLHGQLASAIDNRDKFFPMSGGEQLRDYIAVEQAAENICKIALQNKVIGVVNSCTGNPRTLKEIVGEYISERQSDIEVKYGFYPYRDYEIMEQWGDTTKLNAALMSYDEQH